MRAWWDFKLSQSNWCCPEGSVQGDAAVPGLLSVWRQKRIQNPLAAAVPCGKVICNPRLPSLKSWGRVKSRGIIFPPVFQICRWKEVGRREGAQLLWDGAAGSSCPGRGFLGNPCKKHICSWAETWISRVSALGIERNKCFCGRGDKLSGECSQSNTFKPGIPSAALHCWWWFRLGQVWSENTRDEPKYWGFYMVKRNMQVPLHAQGHQHWYL